MKVYCLLQLDMADGYRHHTVDIRITAHPQLAGKTRIAVNGLSCALHIKSDSGVPKLFRKAA